MITNPNLLKPFIPFSKDSDGGFNSAFYSSNDNKGDIIIDFVSLLEFKFLHILFNSEFIFFKSSIDR